MTPINTADQFVISHDLKVNPFSNVFSYSDYFGTAVKAFDVQTPHTYLEIVSQSLVETKVPQVGNLNATWDDLSDEALTDDLREYLAFTPLVNPITPPFELRLHKSPLDAIQFLNTAMRKQITYAPGSTSVYSPASEAWEKGAGVCQDFTHASLSLLRSVGIPARYVSGYLYNGSGEIGEEVIGESHSWVEAWVGHWLPFDPTNGNPVAEDHVLVARGRDYHDVSPLKGIFSGGRSRKIEVTVSLTRIS
jgi:transglutaminase-like putative cysteine protease